MRIIRTSSGVALQSRLVMTALTMTLLPEPVAPAISRCGIFARSTAFATPATSRPRAKVSLDPDGALARDRRLDPERMGGKRHREVVGQRLDAAQLDVGCRVHLVLRDHRAGIPPHDPCR